MDRPPTARCVFVLRQPLPCSNVLGLQLKALSVLRTQAAAEGVSMLDVAKRTLPGRGDSWVYRQLDALVPSPVPNRRDKRSTGTASPTPSTSDSEDAEHVAAARSSRPDRRSMGTVSPTPSTSDGEDAAHVASVPGRAGSRAELLRPRRRQPSPLAGPSAPIGADDAAGVALASGVDEAKRTSDMVAQFALSVFEGCAEGQPPARRQAVGVLTRYLTAPQERESFAIVKAKGELGMQLWKHTERNYDADLERLRPLAEGAIKRMLARY
jgi:hypothetical protein